MGVLVMGQSLLTREHQALLGAITRDVYLTKQFYFTGGTALSEIYLHHRYSEDLDFFSEADIDAQSLNTSIKNIQRTVNPENIETQVLNGQCIYYFRIGNQRIKVDFAYFPFEPLGEFTKKDNLRVASLLDMAINKVQAIMTRKRSRDFLDLMLINQKLKLEPQTIISNYRLKFDINLAPEELAKHYMGVLDAIDQPRFLGDLPWTKVENFFLSYVKLLKGKT
jgi:predicted nucleotidyltransferase component of viral defense system